MNTLMTGIVKYAEAILHIDVCWDNLLTATEQVLTISNDTSYSASTSDFRSKVCLHPPLLYPLHLPSSRMREALDSHMLTRHRLLEAFLPIPS